MNESPKSPWLPRTTLFFLSLLLCAGMSNTTAHAQQTQERMLVPVGRAVGVKLFSEGLLVTKVTTADGTGKGDSPAQLCGLKEGDLILQFNAEPVDSTEELQELLAENGDRAASLTVRRGSRTLELATEPVEAGGCWRLGAWVRDSMAGIGTVTFYDPQTGDFAALGHGITDVDTGQLMSLAHGSILPLEVETVVKGQSGLPGELRGDFDQTQELGSLTVNSVCGICGTLTPSAQALYTGEAYPVAKREEITEGKATILANVDGTSVQPYEIVIERVFAGNSSQRSLLLRVTDEALLAQTGGIVRGMSGSPILQNGKLVGAVTHVLMDDASRGYGITIDQMLAISDEA